MPLFNILLFVQVGKLHMPIDNVWAIWQDQKAATSTDVNVLQQQDATASQSAWTGIRQREPESIRLTAS